MKSSVLLSGLLLQNISAQYRLIERGRKYSEAGGEQYKIYLESLSGDIVSPWHDVPLYHSQDTTNNTYNMIVEIPRFSQAKFEIHREMRLNPLVQDEEEGRARFLPNVFPWHGSLCNYGALPQTWENPFHRDPWTQLRGDKDPIDVCELGTAPINTGSVLPVRVLGVLGLIDRSETDWKLLVINALEADQKDIQTLEDLESSFPNLLDSVRRYFRIYKVPAGKPENEFAFDGQFLEADFAKEVIRSTHSHWQEMITNCSITGEKADRLSTVNTQLQTSCTITQDEARQEVSGQAEHSPEPAGRPGEVDSWVYVKSITTKNAVDRALVVLVIVLGYLPYWRE